MKFNGGDHLYMQVAEGLEKMISEEVLLIGDKLPSVRVLSEENGISMGTAFQAYYHLEAKGLIESRPKSGYYVRFNHKRFPALPKMIPTDALSHEVSVKEMINSIYGDISAAGVINFALAVPDASLLPVAKINKSVMQALRNSKDHCINYEQTQGNFELRKQIAKLSFNWGGKVKPDEVVITSGCLQAITMCLKAVTKYGDTVAVECPTYFGIYQAIENIGLKVVEITSDPLKGADLDCLEKTIKKFPVKACVFIPNYNNPLSNDELSVKEKDIVDLLVYRQSELGYVMIINNRHTGVLHANEIFTTLHIGDRMQGFIKTIRPDNKIDVVLGKPGFQKVEDESGKILRLLAENNGYLPYHDKSDPQQIYDFFGMSKKTFKMTTGNLYKQQKIAFTKTGIQLVTSE